MESTDENPLKSLFSPLTSAGVAILLFFIGITIYFPSFFNGFVADDYFLVVNNPLVHSLEHLPTLFSGTLGNQGGQYAGLYYRPFMLAYFAIVHVFFGNTPFLYHLMQLLLCIVNAFLLFRILKYFFSLHISFILALLFLVHPLNVETVAWIGGTNDMLFMLFGLITLQFVFKKKSGYLDLVLSGVFLLASYLSKETGLLFVPIIVLFSVFFHKKRLISYLVMIGLSLFPYLLLKLGLARLGFGNIPPNLIAETPLPERLLTVPAILSYYLHNTFVPLGLVMPQGWAVRELTFLDFTGPLVLSVSFFILLLIGLYTFRKQTNKFMLYTLFSIWIIIGFGLHLQLFPLDYTASDRWFYFPFIGMLGVLGIFLERYWGFIIKNRKIFIWAFVSVVCILSILTFHRTTQWKSGLTLWTHDVVYSRPDTELENALGYALIGAQRYEEAEAHLKHSIKLYSNSSNWTNLGVSYVRQKKNEEATAAFEKATSFQNYYLAYENLVLHLYQQKKFGDAIIHAKRGVEKYPTSARLWVLLAASEYKQGNIDSALEAAAKSYSLSPDELNTAIYQELMDIKSNNN